VINPDQPAVRRITDALLEAQTRDLTARPRIGRVCLVALLTAIGCWRF
jgi:hypothetical protein